MPKHHFNDSRLILSCLEPNINFVLKCLFSDVLFLSLELFFWRLLNIHSVVGVAVTSAIIVVLMRVCVIVCMAMISMSMSMTFVCFLAPAMLG